jgi:hypothetical protein
MKWIVSVLVLFLGVGVGFGQIVAGLESEPQMFSGVPFSAEVAGVSETQSNGGPAIHDQGLGRLFRDAEGRTRSEFATLSPSTGQKVERVMINDPVLGISITLDPADRIAVVRHNSRSHGAGAKPTGTCVPHVGVTRLPSGEELKSESLGSREIEGIAVLGTRRSLLIPAGAQQNPGDLLASVTEIWCAPALGINLLSSYRQDELPQPWYRQGYQGTRTLSNLLQEEPDPLLFQIPPDYTVRDEGPAE